MDSSKSVIPILRVTTCHLIGVIVQSPYWIADPGIHSILALHSLPLPLVSLRIVFVILDYVFMCLVNNQIQKVVHPYTSSTVFMTTSESSRGLERTLSHTSTRASTGAKVAARKIRGGRIRGMRVLAHMNTTRWNSINTADREETIQCPYNVRVSVAHRMWST